MATTVVKSQPRLGKWGWGIQLVVSALLALNGVGWFFAGPSDNLASITQDTGITTAEFNQNYPTMATRITTNAHQLAIWYIAFGLLALLVALEGFRRGSRWAWMVLWVLVAATAAVGVNELPNAFGFIMLILTVITLVGQLIARSGLSSTAS